MSTRILTHKELMQAAPEALAEALVARVGQDAVAECPTYEFIQHLHRRLLAVYETLHAEISVH